MSDDTIPATPSTSAPEPLLIESVSWQPLDRRLQPLDFPQVMLERYANADGVQFWMVCDHPDYFSATRGFIHGRSNGTKFYMDKSLVKMNFINSMAKLRGKPVSSVPPDGNHAIRAVQLISDAIDAQSVPSSSEPESLLIQSVPWRPLNFMMITLEKYRDREGNRFWMARQGDQYFAPESGFIFDKDYGLKFNMDLNDAQTLILESLTSVDRIVTVIDRLEQPVATTANIPQASPASSSSPMVTRYFSGVNVHPFNAEKSKVFTATIPGKDGAFIFQQPNVLAPESWSDQSVVVVASKYLWGDQSLGYDPKTGGREGSVYELISRVTEQITTWAKADGYLGVDDNIFADELASITLYQFGAFNSPVWFNVGIAGYGQRGAAQGWRWDTQTQTAIPCEDSFKYPQASACFIQSVADDMGSIMDLARSEAMLFKFGSGSGTDLSTLRSSRETLHGGGTASGPVSFMEGYDAFAGVIKSGGRTRRSAKMQTLHICHPDIMRFITCKRDEDRKARALIAAGYSPRLSGHHAEAYSSVRFQNANLSVRVTDEFMRIAESNGTGLSQETFALKAVKTGETLEKVDPSVLLDEIAAATHECGDPGMQYTDTINLWHTCPNTGPISSSNPCSEYVYIDDSACNLFSLNLLKFRLHDGTFDIGGFRNAVRVAIIAQDVLVDNASYPTRLIAENSRKHRPLGLGYANLGAYLMTLGLPYDSNEGREFAASVTALMHAQAYLTSAELAERLGPFEAFHENRKPMLTVIEKHLKCMQRLRADGVVAARPGTDNTDTILCMALMTMDAAYRNGKEHGFRNSQVTLLAPTGTIAFMMGCATTGVEPAVSLVSYKELAGGGVLKMVPDCVEGALKTLGYEGERLEGILDYIKENDTIEGSSIREAHLPVFDCAFPSGNGTRSISWLAHLRMMAVVQPFLSGAISKTINAPSTATVADIRDIYLEGWRLGLKAVAVYRDGSKGVQPVTTKKADSEVEVIDNRLEPVPEPSPRPATRSLPNRERMPKTRYSVTHKFTIEGRYEFYIHVGLYADGRVGEVWLDCSKEGSTLGGLLASFGVAMSIGLQNGIPLAHFVHKFAHTRFEPHGFTDNPADVPIAKSPIDYVARWLGIHYVPGYREEAFPSLDPIHSPDAEREAAFQPSMPGDPIQEIVFNYRLFLFEEQAGDAVVIVGDTAIATRPNRLTEAPACDVCGALTVPCGSCYRCVQCGTSMGCS